MPNVKFKARGGIRNDVPSERFTDADLLAGVNVDLDKTGGISRRLGTVRLSSGATTSLWAAGAYSFYVRSGTLYQQHADLTTTAVATGVGSRVSYHQLDRTTYWSDGVRSGAVTDGVNTTWGIMPPSASFTVTPTPGDLSAGTYGVTLVYMRHGMESGAPRGQYITLPNASALSLTNLPVSSDPSVTEKALYITRPDGGVFYRAAVIDNLVTATTVSSAWADTIALRTQFKTAAPAGQTIGVFNGIAYVASGSVLFYSDPYEYGLFDLRSNFIPFESEISIFAPVKDGVFVATRNETVFLAGANPTDFNSNKSAPYGGIPGTLVYPRNNLVLKGDIEDVLAMWQSPEGVCVGTTGGQFTNLTGQRYTAATAQRGSSIFKVRDGTPQYLTTLFN